MSLHLDRPRRDERRSAACGPRLACLRNATWPVADQRLRSLGDHRQGRRPHSRHLRRLVSGDWPEREIGWSLYDPADEGKGFAHEAARAAIAHAFDAWGWETAVSYVHPANTRSRALAERLGAALDPVAAKPPAEVPPLVYRHPRPKPGALP